MVGQMKGKLISTSSDGLIVHTYTSPEDGWSVNTHAIELASQIVVVDTQYMLPYAREAAGHIASLGKPVSRVYLTHYHPDHLLGAAAFPVGLTSIAPVKAMVDAAGDRVAQEEHEKHGDCIAPRAERVAHLVEPGPASIDGTRFDFIHLRHAETADALMIGLPEHGILITQDLLYNRVHVFIGEQAFDPWIAALTRVAKLGYGRILPGHGDPGDLSLFDSMRDYLATARSILSAAQTPDEFKDRLIAAFPDHEGRNLLDHELRFLFPSKT
jgi:glyoxylase-like metal-dependent hydrolase (beta-lactamase superfamily II)